MGCPMGSYLYNSRYDVAVHMYCHINVLLWHLVCKLKIYKQLNTYFSEENKMKLYIEKEDIILCAEKAEELAESV